MIIGFRIRKWIFDLENRFQRFKNGYAYSDAWDTDSWYANYMPKLLRHMADKGMGYPHGTTPEEWHDILYKMADLIEKAEYEVNDAWINDDGSIGDWQYHCKLGKKYKDEHFDMMKKWFFDLWD